MLFADLSCEKVYWHVPLGVTTVFVGTMNVTQIIMSIDHHSHQKLPHHLYYVVIMTTWEPVIEDTFIKSLSVLGNIGLMFQANSQPLKI